jgi:beta-glucosidase
VRRLTVAALLAPLSLPAQVDATLGRMTLEEKVGQMTQLTIGALPDAAHLRQAIVDRHVGSILNVVDTALSLDGWHALIRQIQDIATKETRLGVPILYGIDFVHGANYTHGGTIFPHNIGLAATFDPDLVRQVGEVTAREALASGLPWNFAPVLDVGRQPLWPRFYETFGEDPYLAATLGAAAVTGMQSSGRVAATMKHYLGYSGPRTGHDRTPAALTERDVREHYLPPFRAAVAAGADAVMLNSGDIDGMPVHASRHWVTDVLRGELGFQGVVVTDYADVTFLHTRHHVAPTMRDAVRLAMNAGIDMCMTPDNYDFADELLALVRDGTIPERRIDESVRRILTLKSKLGLLAHPYPLESDRAQFAAVASREYAQRAARASITLLKNDANVLPLKKGAKVLVTGPGATSLTMLNGGWTYTWQGTNASLFPPGVPHLLDELRKHADVHYAESAAEAASAARQSDVAIVVLGEDAYAEWIGDIDDLTLSEPQLRLAAAVEATGTPTILVLLEGRPRIIRDVADSARGIVMAYWPGMEGAGAIADVLFGDVNPSGRLPFTYPRYPNALVLDDHRFTETLDRGFDRKPTAYNPQFAFGTGLSYTTFAYSDLQVDHLKVRVTVTNTGTRAGRDVVLLFTHQHFAALTPPMRRLARFAGVDLAPGARQVVTFTLTNDDLAYIGQDGRPVFEPGQFDVIVGDLTRTFTVDP